MSEWLFRNSLENAKVYEKAQSFWESLWQKLVREGSVDHSWQTPWMINKLQDGNPIFTAVSKRYHLGVRIIQEDPQDPDDIDLDCWVDHFGEKTSPDAIRELVIACCPSRENVAEVERLLREWVETGKVTFPASRDIPA